MDSVLKKCNKCLLKFPETNKYFAKKKSCIGGLDTQCKKCKKEYDLKNKEQFDIIRQNWRNENRDYAKEYNFLYRKENRDSLKEYNKQYYIKNKLELVKKNKEYYEENKKHLNDKKSIYNKEKRKKSPVFKLSCNIRTAIWSFLKERNIKKSSKTEKILGCSFEFLKSYLESKFEPWMNWDNYGKYNGKINFGWDLDHIIPIIIAKTEGDVIKLNHYTNFQPLCGYINRNVKKDNF